MVKKLNDMEKVISEKPKQSRRRYVRKLNPKLPKLDVKDFLPKLQGKTGTDLKREVLKIRETLESEYQQLKKRVEERTRKAREEINTKSTETEKKEEIKKEQQDKVILKKADESKKVAIAAVLDYIDTKKTPTQILLEVPAYLNANTKTKQNFMRRLKEEVARNKESADDYVRVFRSADAEDQKLVVESLKPFPTVRALKMTAAERAADGNEKITKYFQNELPPPVVASPPPVVASPPVLRKIRVKKQTPATGMPPLAASGAQALGDPDDTDSEGNVGGAGFAKIKKHAKENNIALLGKEEMLRLGDESISLRRQISQLNALKRNRSVVIRRSDLIDAERPINYELSIL